MAHLIMVGETTRIMHIAGVEAHTDGPDLLLRPSRAGYLRCLTIAACLHIVRRVPSGGRLRVDGACLAAPSADSTAGFPFGSSTQTDAPIVEAAGSALEPRQSGLAGGDQQAVDLDDVRNALQALFWACNSVRDCGQSAVELRIEGLTPDLLAALGPCLPAACWAVCEEGCGGDSGPVAPETAGGGG